MPTYAGGPNDNSTICVGRWVWNQVLQKWTWEGNCMPGIVGGPANQNRTYIPPPNGASGGKYVPDPPPPVPQPKPDPAPQPSPVTGDPPETPPAEKECGPAMATESKYANWKLGYDWKDDLNVPKVGWFGSLPVFTSAVRAVSDDPNKRSKPTYDQFPIRKFNDDGTLRVWQQGHGPGIVVFSPPQLQDYHWYGDEVLPGSDWPTKISQSTLLIYSGSGRADALTADENIARNILAFGRAHRTKNTPVSGIYFRHNEDNGEFCIQGTDSDADDDDSAFTIKVNNIPVAPSVPLTDITQISAQPTWFKFSVDYTEYTPLGGSTGQVTLATLPAGTVVHHTKVKHTTDWNDAGFTMTDVFLSVGTPTAPTRFLRGADVLQPVSGGIFKDSVTGRNTDHTVTTDLEAQINTVGGALSDLNQGAADIYVLLSKVL